MENKQSLPDGVKIIFHHQDMVEDLAETLGWAPERVKEIDGYVGYVISLETFTELGDKNYEYYNIVLYGGIGLDGISGYHLTVEDWEDIPEKQLYDYDDILIQISDIIPMDNIGNNSHREALIIVCEALHRKQTLIELNKRLMNNGLPLFQPLMNFYNICLTHLPKEPKVVEVDI